MATSTNLISYELNGVKESFANWVSNISPTDTPFVSMTGKESIKNKYFQWQIDSLSPVDPTNAQAEGSAAGSASQRPTEVKQNVTQILRKVVQVSDTADALSSYGRGSELAYQMEKAGAEIKRDLEWAFLHNKAPGQDVTAPGTASGGTGADLNVRKTIGFEGLVSDQDSPDAIYDTTGGITTSGVKVVLDIQPASGATAGTYAELNETDLFKVTENLYLAGAQPNIIMFHPKHANVFSGLMERGSASTGAVRVRMFDGTDDTKINTYVSTLVDPLGQEFKLVPNRFMPVDKIYVFDPADWTQMVLRAPQRTKLAKSGSFEKWMIEMEVGLRLRNPWAAGVITLVKK